jgi:hypothetical protein
VKIHRIDDKEAMYGSDVVNDDDDMGPADVVSSIKEGSRCF